MLGPKFDRFNEGLQNLESTSKYHELITLVINSYVRADVIKSHIHIYMSTLR